MRIKSLFLIFAIAVLFVSIQCGTLKESTDVQEYNFETTGESLMNYKVPRWYEDSKFGIYFHWMPFSVAAYKTDDKISVSGWCYVEDTEFWPVDYLIGALADIVSKNGNLLLNVGPRPDGTLREVEVGTLKEIGKWLKVNGEAIYGTRPWRQFGEGTMVKISEDGKQGKSKVGPDCVRFTVKGQTLYAICFGWPESGEFTIKSLSSKNPLSEHGIKSIAMLGSDEDIHWNQIENGLEVVFPTEAPCDYAYVLKIVPKGGLLFTE